MARHLRRTGAQKVVGIDISDKMIAAAQATERKQNLQGLHYATGNSTDLVSVLEANSESLGLETSAGKHIQYGGFQLAVAVFLFVRPPPAPAPSPLNPHSPSTTRPLPRSNGRLIPPRSCSAPCALVRCKAPVSAQLHTRSHTDRYRVGPSDLISMHDCEFRFVCVLQNYLTNDEMQLTMMQVYDLLLPGGAFVFSVPHPMMAGKHHKTGDSAEFGFGGDGSYTGYFSSRDVSLPGVITTKDGQKLNVRMVHKTFEDYFVAIRKIGFEFDSIKECHVTPEHLEADPTFFSPLVDLPLHIVFRVVKPVVNDAVCIPSST